MEEPPVDMYWNKQTGKIERKRDPVFCRHNDNAMCDYCMPLEVSSILFLRIKEAFLADLAAVRPEVPSGKADQAPVIPRPSAQALLLAIGICDRLVRVGGTAPHPLIPFGDHTMPFWGTRALSQRHLLILPT